MTRSTASLGLRRAGDERARLGVIDAQLAALGRGARGARGVLGGDRVEPVAAEGERQHELADVMQQAAEMRDVRGCAGPLGDRLRGPGDRGGVQMQVPIERPPLPGARWMKR